MIEFYLFVLDFLVFFAMKISTNNLRETGVELKINYYQNTY